MNIFKLIFGKTQKDVLDLNDIGSPDPKTKPKYWTRHNLNWNNVQGVRVIGDSVYLVRQDREDELIAIRSDNGTAMGYADALSRNRRVPILGMTKHIAA